MELPQDINYFKILGSILGVVFTFIFGKLNIWIAKHYKIIVASNKTIEDFKEEQNKANHNFQKSIDVREDKIEKEVKESIKLATKEIREETDRKLRNYGDEIDNNRSKVENLFERLGKSVDSFDSKMKNLSEEMKNNSISKREYYVELSKIQKDLLKELGDVRVDVSTMSVTLVDSQGNKHQTPNMEIPEVITSRIDLHRETLDAAHKQISGIEDTVLRIQKEHATYEEKNNRLHGITKEIIERNMRFEKGTLEKNASDFSIQLGSHKIATQKKINNIEKEFNRDMSLMNRKLTDMGRVVKYVNDKIRGNIE